MASLKRPKLSGKCVYCEKAYTLATIGRHLISCEKRKEQVSKGKTHKTFILARARWLQKNEGSIWDSRVW